MICHLCLQSSDEHWRHWHPTIADRGKIVIICDKCYREHTRILDKDN